MRRLLTLLAVLLLLPAFAASPVLAAFAPVQSVQNATGSGTSLAIAIAPSRIGNLVVVGIKFGNGGGTTASAISVTDSAGNVYSNTGLSRTGTALGFDVHQFYGVQAAGGAATVTVRWTGTQSARVTVSEFSGNDPNQATVFDTGRTGESTAGVTSGSVAPFAPSATGNLIFAYYGFSGAGAFTNGASYVIAETTTNGATQYRLSSSSSETAPGSWTNSVGYRVTVGSYKPGTVTPPPPAPTVTLSASPVSVASGGSSTLTWSSTNATSCTASGAWSGTQATSDTQGTGPLAASSTYTLTCTGAGGSANQSATVTVVPAPTVALGASPVSVASGGSSTLTWSSTNATSCTASGAWSGTQATSGTLGTGPLAASSTYTLTCTGAGASASQSATVTVTAPVPTVTLAASPVSVASGGSSTLTWSSTNATSCTASGAWSGAQATSGTQGTGPLSANSTYTLTCTGAGGSASQSATVTVTPIAPPAAVPALVQSAGTISDSSRRSISQAFSSGTTAGNLIVVAVSWGNGPASPSVVDSRGNAYALATNGYSSAGDQSLAIYYAANINGGTDTVTVNFGSNRAWRRIIVAEYSGVARTNPVDGVSANQGSATAAVDNVTSNSINTTQNGDLIFGAVENYGGTGTVAAGSGYALRNSLLFRGAIETGIEDNVQTAAGPVAATFTYTAAGGYLAQAVAFKPGVAAPVVTLSVSPASVASGGASTLTWSSTNATSCTASGAWSGGKATSGSASTGALSATSTYTLTCTGAGGSASQSATVTVVPAPTVALGASPASVASGGSSTLTWSSTNATSCTASGAWSGSKATSGSASTGPLSANSTYTLTCTGVGGSANQSATVTVTAPVPAPVVTLSASPASVASGGASTLTWSSTNATSCTASGAWSGSKATSGSASTGALSATSTYTLTCTGSGGSAGQSATVTVTAAVPAPTVTLSASPTSVASGGSSTLSWSSTNATSCTASGAWSGAQATSGTQGTGPLSANSTYTLTCSNSAGVASGSATVNVNSGTAPTVTLSVSPTSVPSGGSATLTWTSTNAAGCTASGAWSGARATSGSQSTGLLAIASFYSLTCAGAGGSASAAVNVGVIGPGASPVYPLHVEAGKRYLVDASGNPFLIHGDSPWSLASQLTREDAEIYLENRRLKGFNTILMNLIEHKFAANPPLNAYGAAPFLVPDDFSTPNEAYFAHVEYVISRAAAKGILVVLFPSYMGYAGASCTPLSSCEGWYQVMQANGATKLRAYGQYLANRFRPYDNIVWAEGGDYNPGELDLLRAVTNGIRDVDTRWLHTFHGSRGTAALQFLGTTEAWLQLNNIYTDSATVVASAFQEYNRSVMPFFLFEALYEGEGATQATVRQQAYQAVLSGGGGQLMGNNPIWPFGAGWQAALESGGSRTLLHLRTLLEARSWSTLLPDVAGAVLTGGIGAGAGRAATASAADRSSVLIYTPDVRSLTVNLGQLAGPNVVARWYDPGAGTYATIGGSPFPASGGRTFTPAGNNASGFGDWVLVLDSTP